jgi:hypothetical protein
MDGGSGAQSDMRPDGYRGLFLGLEWLFLKDA